MKVEDKMDFFDRYHRDDFLDSIDLKRSFTRDYTVRKSSVAEDFLDNIENLGLITSEQIAAIAVSMAEFIASVKPNSPLPDH